MHAYENECEAAGLDPKEVERIAKGLSRYARQADKLGIGIFGGSGSGSLRFRDEAGKNIEDGRALVIADIDGQFDGGDGACDDAADGLLRGE